MDIRHNFNVLKSKNFAYFLINNTKKHQYNTENPYFLQERVFLLQTQDIVVWKKIFTKYAINRLTVYNMMWYIKMAQQKIKLSKEKGYVSSKKERREDYRV